jgi:drug/metabolite transporter (DMT)-like permease
MVDVRTKVGEVALPAAGRPLVLVLLLFMGALWGGQIALARLATLAGGHPLGLALWQTTGGGLILLVLSLVQGCPPSLSPRVLRFCALCGLIGLAVPVCAITWTASRLPAGLVAIVLATMPLFTYGVSAASRVERIERLRLLGVAVGLVATVLLVLPKSALPAPGLVPWVLLALFASLSMSAENLYVAVRRPPEMMSLSLSCSRQFAAAAFLAPVALALGATVPVFAPWGPVQWAATGMAASASIAYTTYLYVIRVAGPVFASQVAYVITLAGVGWGLLLFGEHHSPFAWAALALMLLGLVLVRPREPAQPTG